MITSPHNEKLKLIRKLHERKHRARDGLFIAEGEDLVEAARDAGLEPELELVAGEDVGRAGFFGRIWLGLKSLFGMA